MDTDLVVQAPHGDEEAFASPNDSGVGNGNARNDGIAGGTAVSVVVHAPGGAKIACADLE
ncbi:MAG: hypothetical protein H0V74_02020 [Chloroflexi bacterium]|nr:hypothetical protein [Chloroflexota bacterium]